MMFPKPEKLVKDRAWLKRVAELPCIICGVRPVQVHHCIHGRYSQRKVGDRETIPLCFSCHWRLHNHPAQWKHDHGLDRDYLPYVFQKLIGETE